MPEVELVIDDEVEIVSESEIRDLQDLTRNGSVDSQNMVSHPDGSIWINTTEPKPGLLKSEDRGRTWSWVPVSFLGLSKQQTIAGMFITRDGAMWLVHSDVPVGLFDEMADDARAFVSRSSDQGKTWETTDIDPAGFAPGYPEDPYTFIGIVGCHPNFIERPDGTVMFSASMRYDDWENYGHVDQSRPGPRDVMIRTKDNGRTWGDPTVVHQHATETAYAVDPKDPDHIIAATRIQRNALPGEDSDRIKKEITGVPLFLDADHPWVKAGNPPNTTFCYKNGMLIESMDGGRTFREIPDGLYGYGGYRWSMVWTDSNILILVSFAGYEVGEPPPHSISKGDRHVARVSLDGGRTWIDGTSSGTVSPNKAKKFTIVPSLGIKNGYSTVVSATMQLGQNSFISTYRYKSDGILGAKFWHLENLP